MNFSIIASSFAAANINVNQFPKSVHQVIKDALMNGYDVWVIQENEAHECVLHGYQTFGSGGYYAHATIAGNVVIESTREIHGSFTYDKMGVCRFNGGVVALRESDAIGDGRDFSKIYVSASLLDVLEGIKAEVAAEKAAAKKAEEAAEKAARKAFARKQFEFLQSEGFAVGSCRKIMREAGPGRVETVLDIYKRMVEDGYTRDFANTVLAGILHAGFGVDRRLAVLRKLGLANVFSPRTTRYGGYSASDLTRILAGVIACFNAKGVDSDDYDESWIERDEAAYEMYAAYQREVEENQPVFGRPGSIEWEMTA